MKKNDWILIVAVSIYSFLFYAQTPGINFLLFNVALIGLLIYRNTNVLQNKTWLMAVAGSLLSATAVTLYSSTLAIFLNIISLGLLSGLSIHKRTSIVTTFFFSVYSVVLSFYFMFVDLKIRSAQSTRVGNALNRFGPVLIAIPLTLVFFVMYRIANPIFDDFVEKLYIDWGLIFFTLLGFVLLYGFFYYRRIKEIAELDESGANNLTRLPHKSIVVFDKNVTLEDENSSGKILLIMLNALLLIVNLLDIDFLFVSHRLPEGLSYSKYVHQGVGMLIFSILFAIAIILFYFRSAINFYEKNKVIKMLAYAWIIQNAFMLISTLCRNNMYIEEYGLTYKRIGVYVYLILTLIGLTTTFIKIMKIKSNHFLFRTNSWAFYAVLVLLCLVNWDTCITSYNVYSAKNKGKAYLFELGYSSLPELVHLQHMLNYYQPDSTFTPNDNASDEETEAGFNRSLGRKLYYFMLVHQQLGWRSWYVEDTRVYNDLVRLNESKELHTLDLSRMDLYDLNNLNQFNNIHVLNLRENRIFNVDALQGFTSLQKLDLSDNQLSTLKHIEEFKKLQFLSLSGNPILDYSPLYALRNNLEVLQVDSAISHKQFALLVNNMPDTKIIK